LPVIRVNPDFNPFDPPRSDDQVTSGGYAGEGTPARGSAAPSTASGTAGGGFRGPQPDHKTPKLNLGNWEQLYSISRAEEPAQAARLLPEEARDDEPVQEL